MINQTLKWVLSISNLKYNGVTDPLAFRATRIHTESCSRFLQQFQQKYQMPPWTNILRSTLISHCLFFVLILLYMKTIQLNHYMCGNSPLFFPAKYLSIIPPSHLHKQGLGESVPALLPGSGFPNWCRCFANRVENKTLRETATSIELKEKVLTKEQDEGEKGFVQGKQR